MNIVEAIKTNNTELFKTLFEHTCQKEKADILLACTMLNQPNILSIIVPQVIVTEDSLFLINAALRKAAERGFIECLKQLIDISDVNHEHSKALRLAAGRGHIQGVILLEPLCSSSLHQAWALTSALQRGHYDCADVLCAESDLTATLIELQLIGNQDAIDYVERHIKANTEKQTLEQICVHKTSTPSQRKI